MVQKITSAIAVAYKLSGRLVFFSFTRAKYKKGQESCREKLLEKSKQKENQFLQSPTPTGMLPVTDFCQPLGGDLIPIRPHLLDFR